MPKLFDRLPHSDKAIAERIIKNISDLKPEAERYLDLAAAFKIKLAQAKSTNEFHAIVNAIIEKGKVIAVTLEKATAGMNDNIRFAVDEYIAEHADLERTMNGLRMLRGLSSSIIATKERLSEQELFASVSDENKAILVRYANTLKAMKPLADIYDGLKKQFEEKLANANSPSEVDDIENTIIGLNKPTYIILSAISAQINKELSETVNKYLEINHHLKSILQSFNLHENLTDDILAARANNTFKPRASFN